MAREREAPDGKVGAPPIDIKKEEVEQLAKMGCLNTEIADFFGVDESTIRHRFGDQLTKGRATMKMSIRRKQLEKALGGDTTMLIWVGKNVLDQKDKQEMTGADGGPVKHEFKMSVEERAERLKKIKSILEIGEHEPPEHS